MRGMEQMRIHSLGRQGDGVADGPTFVPGALPGEVVTGTRDGDTMSDVKIVEPCEMRVRAPCSHFKSCGGCTLQHAADDFVADWKADLVRQALYSQGLETEIRATLTSPSASRRRATFAARRTKKGALVGFHGRASSTILPVPNCTLITPELKAGLTLGEALAVEVGSRKGTLDIACTSADSGLDVAVTGGKPMDEPLRFELTRLAAEHDLARLTWDQEVVVERHPVMQSFDGVAVRVPPGGFLQATAHGEQTLQSLVQDCVGDAKSVVDLFAGAGTFALPLARKAEVLAVEGDEAAIAAMDRAWREATGLKRVTSERRDLFRRPLMPDELRHDAVVIDPPRAGAAAQIAELAKTDVPVIAHVSCNPATFARDAKTLIDSGYTLNWVQPVDQFRWSTHVELVGQFTR